VTVRHVGDGGIAAAHLGYYHARPAVREVAFAPIPHPDEDATSYFLVADAEAAERLGPARSRQVLAQFARTVGALLTPADDEEPATADTVGAEGEADGAEGSAVRPRRDIIAEEIAKARAADVPLALALVYLNQADTVADEGEGAIAATERDLAATLHQAAASCRVERFGELTFGVFYQDATDVERWTERIQQRLDAAGGALDGGVSIGVALLKERHEDPTAFRADATEALREAYESGASIILE
jgi:GGDEF domain-containing protein